MTSSLVERVTDDQLMSEKNDILARVGMTEAELLERGDAWTLDTEEQWQAHTRIEGIRFLLGEDA